MIVNKKYLFFFLMVISLIIITVIFDFNRENTNTLNVNKEINKFNLLTHEGNNFTYKSFSNLPSLFFFGFLNCPDICPITVERISRIIEELHGDSDKLRYFFVTVDPDRDTPNKLKDYLEAFSDKILGITGNKDDVHSFLKHMYVYFKKIPINEEFFTFDHSSQIFLFDRHGNFYGTISLDEKDKVALDKIKSML